MGPSTQASLDGDGGLQRVKLQFVAGRFYASFPDERTARAAAIDARAAGFVVDVHETSVGVWAMLARRKEPFPDGEQKRYAARLSAIVTSHDGSDPRFLPD